MISLMLKRIGPKTLERFALALRYDYNLSNKQFSLLLRSISLTFPAGVDITLSLFDDWNIILKVSQPNPDRLVQFIGK